MDSGKDNNSAESQAEHAPSAEIQRDPSEEVPRTPSIDMDGMRELSGNYRIEGRCGIGGCAVVNEGYRLSDNKHVAIKILSLPVEIEPEEAEKTRLRFFREARLIASMHSPHVVECVEYGLFESRPCMILEFLEGLQLDDYIKTRGAMSFEDSVELIKQVLQGLAVSHEMGVIHRDIKPSNIMVLGNKRPLEVRIYDFGIATVLDDAPGDLMRTQVGSIRGTPSYMAPELFSGETRASAATDIYAVGLVLYECLTGTIAVMGTSLIQIAYKQMHEMLVVPSFIPECLANVVLKCCAKNADERYQNTQEVIDALDAALPEAIAQRVRCESQYLESIRTKGFSSGQQGKSDVSKTLLGAVIAVALICIVLAVYLIVRDDPHAPQAEPETAQQLAETQIPAEVPPAPEIPDSNAAPEIHAPVADSTPEPSDNAENSPNSEADNKPETENNPEAEKPETENKPETESEKPGSAAPDKPAADSKSKKDKKKKRSKGKRDSTTVPKNL